MKNTFPSNHRGQSLVEIALLLPVLLLLIVVIIDMGRGVYYFSVIYNAAREGARYGIIHPDDIVGIRDAAANLAIGIDLHPEDVEVLPDPPNKDVETIQINIEYPFQLVTPIASLFTKCKCDIIDLRTSSTMYVER
jgi:hypothetical protein